MVVGAPAQQNFALFIFNNDAAGTLYQCPMPYDFAQIRYITAQKIPPLHSRNASVFFIMLPHPTGSRQGLRKFSFVFLTYQLA